MNVLKLDERQHLRLKGISYYLYFVYYLCTELYICACVSLFRLGTPSHSDTGCLTLPDRHAQELAR